MCRRAQARPCRARPVSLTTTSCWRLPAFLLDETAPIADTDIAAGFALTGYFLQRDVLEPHGLKLPQARDRLLDLLARRQNAALPA